jgi:hydroxysqualene dehydroxylase
VVPREKFPALFHIRKYRMTTVHVIGAGISGLACATRAALSGVNVALYEAAGHAGGRSRSFHDDSLGCVIDNGNHLLLGANESTRAYLSDLGAENMIREIAPAAFPFIDLKTGERWRVRPGGGLLPTWILSAGRRIPGTTAGDYLKQVYRLNRAGKQDTVLSAVGSESVLYETLWQPLCRAALNTDATEASARLLWTVVRETFMKGEAACRPWFFHKGLSAALVTPALKLLTESGADVRFKARLRGMRWADHRITSLYFPEGMLKVAPEDAVVLALPPEICNDIWPEAKAPTDSRTIVNAHFRMDAPPTLPWESPFIGVIQSETHWVFVRDNIVSLTISAGDALADKPNWEIANILWAEAAKVMGSSAGRMPAWRIIKERRATFAQTPTQVNSRPGTETSIKNLFLAGDWTDTGLPATIEGSVRSGFKAASSALKAIQTAQSEATN